MARRSRRKVYVVQAIHWRYNDESFDPMLSDEGPLRAFADRANGHRWATPQGQPIPTTRRCLPAADVEN